MTSYDGSLPPGDGRWWYWNTGQQAWVLASNDEPDADDDPHAGCYQPHRGPAGNYHDCDGRPL